MSDPNESDYAVPPHNVAPVPTTTPPMAKTAREISRGVNQIGIPAMLLVAAILKIPHADEAFLVACLIVLVGHFALRKAEGMPDMEGLIATLLSTIAKR